jgi:hypothetical protein
VPTPSALRTRRQPPAGRGVRAAIRGRLEALRIDRTLCLVECAGTAAHPGIERTIHEQDTLALFVDISAVMLGGIAHRLELFGREIVRTLDAIDLRLEGIGFGHHLVELRGILGARRIAGDQRTRVFDQLGALRAQILRLHFRAPSEGMPASSRRERVAGAHAAIDVHQARVHDWQRRETRGFFTASGSRPWSP